MNRAISMARDRAVNAIDGSRVALEVETICVHGDTPGAAVLASRIRKALIDAGVSVLPVGAASVASARAHGFRNEHTPQNLSHHRLRQLGAELDGRNCRASLSRHDARISSDVGALATSRLRTIHAFATSPLAGSGMPATPTSNTAGCAEMTSSISRGHTWNPLVFSMSFLRSTRNT